MADIRWRVRALHIPYSLRKIACRSNGWGFSCRATRLRTKVAGGKTAGVVLHHARAARGRGEEPANCKPELDRLSANVGVNL